MQWAIARQAFPNPHGGPVPEVSFGIHPDWMPPEEGDCTTEEQQLTAELLERLPQIVAHAVNTIDNREDTTALDPDDVIVDPSQTSRRARNLPAWWIKAGMNDTEGTLAERLRRCYDIRQRIRADVRRFLRTKGRRRNPSFGVKCFPQVSSGVCVDAAGIESTQWGVPADADTF